MKIVIIIAVIIAAAFSYIYYQNRQVPGLGVEKGKLKPLSNKPNCISSQTDLSEKLVDPLVFKENREKTMKAILESVAAYGGAEVILQEDDYLYVVFTTPMMKFHDDVEFYLDTKAKLVHFRSSSRAGYSDQGLNRRRYEELVQFYMQR